LKEKKRLGRGLGALINEALTGEENIMELPLDQVKPNPLQPRSAFDPGRLEELADSIREHGVVQAVIVSPAPRGGYYLVAGERRCRAAKMAGLTKVPALVRELDERAMLEIALIENLQREDLNPIEEASSYRRLMDEFALTQEELGRRLGKSRPAIANAVRLLSLPQSVQKAIIEKKLNVGQARPLLAIEDRSRQEEMARQIIEGKLTAREAEKLTGKGAKTGQKRRREVPEPADPLTKELQGRLQRQLGTRVKIYRRRGGGSIEISFYGEDDLERLISLLMPTGLD
jgi:ParB family chromosome partitioning protein